MSSQGKNPGSAHVELSDDGIIRCTLQGFLTGSIVRNSMQRTRQLADVQKAAHKPVRLLLDVSGVAGQTSSARSQAKALGNYGFDRIGVYGANRVQRMIGQYIVKAGGMGSYTKFCATESAALAWVRASQGRQHEATRGWGSWLAVVSAAVCLLILAGWSFGIPLLAAGAPGLRPANPTASLVLLLVSLSAITVGTSLAHRKLILRTTSILSITFGILVLVRYITGFDTRIDKLLFTNLIVDTGALRSRTATSLAVCMILIGVMVWTLNGKRWGKRQQIGFHLSSLATTVIALFTLISYSFGNQIGINRQGLMAVSAAVMVLLISASFQCRAPQSQMFAKPLTFARNYWPAGLVMLLLVLTTGVAWQQARQVVVREQANIVSDTYAVTKGSLAKHFDGYLDALRGFKAFFEASDQVTADDYETYYQRTEIAERYPGFYTLAFIRSVDRSQAAALTKLMNQGKPYSQYPGIPFRTYPDTDSPLLFPAIYTMPRVPGVGFDAYSDPVRRSVYERARDTGQPASSGVINLNASRREAGERKGLFIAVPVYKPQRTQAYPDTIDERRQSAYGFLVAAFQNDEFFGGILGTDKDHTRFVLRNNDDHTVLYDSGVRPGIAATPVMESAITVAGQDWRLSMYAVPHLNQDASNRTIPRIILISGLLLTALAGALMASLTRRRERAMMLAERITEDLNAERNSAIANQKKDEAVLSSIGDAVFAVDKKRRLTVFNKVAEDLSGHSREHALGKPYDEILEFVSERTGQRSHDFIDRAFKGKVAAMKLDVALKRQDGSLLAVADSAAPIRDSRGTIQGVIVVFRDVSKERTLDNAKTEFVSLASHQLRTPLSAINWYSEMLLNDDAGKLNHDQRQYIREIFNGNQRMIELVNALLDVSRLEVGKLASNPEPTDVRELVHGVEQELRGAIGAKHQNYASDIDEGLPDLVIDPKLLRMVVQNLLSNAVKYTLPNGSIRLSFERAGDDELKRAGIHHGNGDAYALLTVSDDGLGIPAVQQPKIFSKLFRADNVQSLDVEGTGLGLYIVKQVVDKLGGRIRFESAEKLGTTFYVLIPMTHAADTKKSS